MKAKHLLYLLLLASLPILTACDLEKEIEVALPEHTPQLVVECYLEPGQPIRASVLESQTYFADEQLPVLPNAKVTVSHNGRQIKLKYNPVLNRNTSKFYTHRSSEIMRGKPGDIYSIEVTDDKGRRVTGFTTIVPSVPIDTVEWQFNENEEAYVLVSFQDNPDVQNNYRFMIHRDSLTNSSDRDFISNDNLTNGKYVSFGTAYDYEQGDTLIISLFNIEKQYYDFISSVSDAKNANGNPFAQPARLKSSVQGGIGIFTNLAYDRKMIIIK